MTKTDVKTLNPAEQNTVEEIYNFLRHGVQADGETIQAAMELRQGIARSQELLALLHSGDVTASRCFPDYVAEGDREYVYGYTIVTEAAKKYFNSNRREVDRQFESKRT